MRRSSLCLLAVALGCADPAGQRAAGGPPGGARDMGRDHGVVVVGDARLADAGPTPDGAPTDAAQDAASRSDVLARGFYDDDFPPGPVDRAGRPAVTFGLLDDAALDAYNQDHANLEWPARWTDRVAAGITALDGLNGREGDSLLPAGGLAVVFVREYLLIDVSKPYAPEGFLDRELVFGFLLDEAEATSGGRSLEEDVTDAILDVMVGAPQAGDRWDCVDENDVPRRDTFPYVAPPH